MLEKVKANLGITGDFQNDTIEGYIAEVQEFLKDSGVDSKIVEDVSIAGLISRGVADLWEYGSGRTSLSPYFIQRVIQLASKQSEENNQS